MIKSKVHAVIFDLDGTLSDSSVLTIEAMNRVSLRFCLPTSTQEVVRMATGYANPEFYHILFPDAPRNVVEELGVLVEREELLILPSVSDKL